MSKVTKFLRYDVHSTPRFALFHEATHRFIHPRVVRGPRFSFARTSYDDIEYSVFILYLKFFA